MHGDLEPGQDPALLPPFIARPPAPERAPGGDRPLPPWSSTGRELSGPEPLEAAPEVAEADSGAIDMVSGHEPWPGGPDGSDDTETAFTTSDEPWPGDEIEDLETLGVDSDPWAPVEEPVAEEEPWALPEAAPSAEAEPWTTSAAGTSSADDAAEPLALDEPWAASQGESEWDAGLVLDEPVGETEPWIAAEPNATAVPGDRPESHLPPLPASPLDELVETAGQALAGSGSAWAEAPLDTWPGEAEAWDAAAAGGAAETAAEPDRGIEALADRLDELADELRSRGAAALERSAGRDRLGTALAAFLAGWRAARDDD